MTGTYEIIYADPPWRYSAKKVQGAAENHYPTMSIDELCALPVAELAAKDSALFMWATFPQLPEALRLIRAWGFTYKSVAFVWLKKNKKADSWFYGLGFWTRANAEICLLAYVCVGAIRLKMAVFIRKSWVLRIDTSLPLYIPYQRTKQTLHQVF